MTDEEKVVPIRPKRELPESWKAQQWASTKHKRDEVLDLIGQGLNMRQAAIKAGVVPQLVYKWKTRYPEFKTAVDMILGATGQAQAPETIVITKDSTFAEKRYAFFNFKTYWHHHRIIDAIETAPAGGVTLILCPPDHAKTTVCADYISVAIGEKPNIRIGYVSGGLDLARKAVAQQQARLGPEGLINFPRFHAQYGPFYEEGRNGKPWTADYFSVLKADHDEKERTMEARGWKSRIAGARIDLMIIDDIQEVTTLNDTEQMVEKFSQDMLSRIGRRGKVIIIGTRVGEKDFYNAILELGLVDKLVQLPATNGELVDRCEREVLLERWQQLSQYDRQVLRHAADKVYERERLTPAEQKAWDAESDEVRWAILSFGPNEPVGPCDIPDVPHEKPLCPEMWPPHALARKRKQVREAAWWRNFQQKPRNAKDATFTEDMVEQARNKMSTLADAALRTKGWRRFAGLDPSLTGGNSLIGCEGSGIGLRVLGLSRNFGMTRVENIIDDIDRGWKLWQFTDLIIEINAFQKALGNDQRLRDLSRLRGFRIHQHTTGINKLDPDFGVARMASIFLDGQIEWPWGDEAAKAEMGILEAELLAWREGVPTRKLRQDTVMSLWFCWEFWAKRRKGWLMEDSSTGPRIQRAGLPWAVGGMQQVRDLARALQ